MTHTLKGYLLIYRMADVSAPYSNLTQLAQDTGFDPAYIPGPPTPKHAWEKATNIRKQKLIAPQGFVAQIKAQYDCEPTVQAETKIVSGEIRHLVRTVAIKRAGHKDKQLDMKSVAILQYDEARTLDVDKFVGLYHLDFDSLGATNGNIPALVQRCRSEYERQLVNADGQDVRYYLRSYLDKVLRATLLADGTYFVRSSVLGVEDKLVSFQAYVLDLAKWKVNDNTLMCQVFPVADDGTALSQQNMRQITSDVVEKLKRDLSGVLKDLNEPDSRGLNATEKKQKKTAAKFLEIKNDIEEYRQVLGEEIEALGDLVKICGKAVLKAVA